MKHLQYSVMVALLLLLAACGQTQAPGAALDEEPGLQTTAASAHIYGTVVFDTGHAVSGASVTLEYWNGRQWLDVNGGRTKTNSTGGFTFYNASTNWYYRVRAGWSHVLQGPPLQVFAYEGRSPYWLHRSAVNVRVTIRRTL